MFEKGFLQDVRHNLWEICPDEGAVAGYGNRIRAKSPAKWGVQIAGMIFQAHSKIPYSFNVKKTAGKSCLFWRRYFFLWGVAKTI